VVRRRRRSHFSAAAASVMNATRVLDGLLEEAATNG